MFREVLTEGTVVKNQIRAANKEIAKRYGSDASMAGQGDKESGKVVGDLVLNVNSGRHVGYKQWNFKIGSSYLAVIKDIGTNPGLSYRIVKNKDDLKDEGRTVKLGDSYKKTIDLGPIFAAIDEIR